MVNAAILANGLRYKCSRTFRTCIPWQSVDKYFLNLLSVSCVMCFLIHALVNLEAPGFYPSPYFLQTYGQLGDDIDGRGWEEKNSQMLSGSSASRSIKSQFLWSCVDTEQQDWIAEYLRYNFFHKMKDFKGLLEDPAHHSPLTAVMRVNKANLKWFWQPSPCHEVRLVAKYSGLSTKQQSKLLKSFV